MHIAFFNLLAEAATTAAAATSQPAHQWVWSSVDFDGITSSVLKVVALCALIGGAVAGAGAWAISTWWGWKKQWAKQQADTKADIQTLAKAVAQNANDPSTPEVEPAVLNRVNELSVQPPPIPPK